MASKAKRIEHEVARKEIDRLFALAGARAHPDDGAADGEKGVDPVGQRFADRCVRIARDIASRNRVSLRRYNRVHCRKCACYFTAATLRVRTRGVNIVYSCLRCGDVTRIRKK